MSAPHRRNRSRVVQVAGEDWQGPCTFEVYSEQWRSPVTGRYTTMWSARRTGRLAWDTGRDPRSALARAALVRARRRPRWLASAVAEVRRQLL